MVTAALWQQQLAAAFRLQLSKAPAANPASSHAHTVDRLSASQAAHLTLLRDAARSGSTSGRKDRYHTKYCAVDTCRGTAWQAGRRSARTEDHVEHQQHITETVTSLAASPPTCTDWHHKCKTRKRTLLNATNSMVCSRKQKGRSPAQRHPTAACSTSCAALKALRRAGWGRQHTRRALQSWWLQQGERCCKSWQNDCCLAAVLPRAAHQDQDACNSNPAHHSRTTNHQNPNSGSSSTRSPAHIPAARGCAVAAGKVGWVEIGGEVVARVDPAGMVQVRFVQELVAKEAVESNCQAHKQAARQGAEGNACRRHQAAGRRADCMRDTAQRARRLIGCFVGSRLACARPLPCCACCGCMLPLQGKVPQQRQGVDDWVEAPVHRQAVQQRSRHKPACSRAGRAETAGRAEAWAGRGRPDAAAAARCTIACMPGAAAASSVSVCRPMLPLSTHPPPAPAAGPAACR